MKSTFERDLSLGLLSDLGSYHRVSGFSPRPLMKKRCWQFVFAQCCANNPYHAAVKCLAGIIADRQPQITELLGFVLCTEKVWLFIVILILVIYIWHQVELV